LRRADIGAVKISGCRTYIGIGLTGKVVTDISEKRILKVLNGATVTKPISRGWTMEQIWRWGRVQWFYVGAYYALGHANLAVATDGGYKESHRVISFSVGYKFGK
jgi:hypothetical protein